MRRRNIQNAPRAAAGFTLLEVLVSFLLLGVLMSTLYGALNLGTRTSAAVDRVTEETQTTLLAQNFLRGLLQRARGRAIPEPNGRHAISFTGSGKWVRFVATLPDAEGRQRDYLFELGLSDQGNNTNLYLEYARISSIEAGWRRLLAQRVVLVRNVSDLKMEYLKGDDGYGAKWLPEWSRQGSLPMLVRINLEEANGSWPEFIVQPKVRTLIIDEADEV